MMRDLDRKVMGYENYPMVMAPELYVMKGGYCKFYE